MKRIRDIKRTSDGRTMLNIGCGVKMHQEWNNIDFSPYAWLAGRDHLAAWLYRVGLLSDQRYQRHQSVDPDAIYWDLRQGLPFEDETFDVVYHSHFIAHVGRRVADYLTRECRRVLKPGGVHRVVTNDFEQLVDLYSEAVETIQSGDEQKGMQWHESVMAELFELMVHEEPYGTQKQTPLVRFIERFARSPESAGERRQWYYDQYSMGRVMREAGLTNVQTMDPKESRIEGWNDFGLDLNPDGTVYKKRSFWMEAVNPSL